MTAPRLVGNDPFNCASCYDLPRLIPELLTNAHEGEYDTRPLSDAELAADLCDYACEVEHLPVDVVEEYVREYRGLARPPETRTPR